MNLPEVDDFEGLFINNRPLLDVRAPLEFCNGAFPNATNIALLNNSERERIGIHYKEQGHDAAVELGAQLVKGKVKSERVQQWSNYIKLNPNAVLYCFRGGMRSQITQQWIFEETGKVVPRVRGGYKALRRYLIEQTDSLSAKTRPLILSGRTGAGKTHLIKRLKHMIDLEGLANHRGSSIGRQISPQPTQIAFENAVAIELLKLHSAGVEDMVFEDESPNIGSVHIPHPLYAKMREAPCVVLDTKLDDRIKITRAEYVTDMLQAFVDHAESPEQGFSEFSEYLKNSLARVQRRLGGQRYKEVLNLMNQALAMQLETGETRQHSVWIKRMLVEYYDPMYDYQREKRHRSVLNTASFSKILAYLSAYQ